MRSVAGSSTPASASESPPRNILDEIWTILHGRKPLPGGERAPEQCQGRAYSWRTSDEASAAAAASSEFTLSAGEASYEALQECDPPYDPPGTVLEAAAPVHGVSHTMDGSIAGLMLQMDQLQQDQLMAQAQLMDQRS